MLSLSQFPGYWKESSEILRDDRIMLSKDAFLYFILKITFLIEI